MKDRVRWSKAQSISTKHTKLGDIHKQQGKMSKSKGLSWKQQGDEEMDVGLCRHTHSRAGGQKSCSAKAHKLEHCSFTGQLSP